MQVLILYFSKGGNTRKLAEAIAKGVEAVEGASALLRKTDAVTKDDFLSSNGVIAGSPVYFGSATGEIKKASTPVIQKIFRKEYPALTSLIRNTSKICRSSIAFIKVIATSKNRNSSAYSSMLCLIATSATPVIPFIEYIRPISPHMIPAANITGFDFLMWVTSSSMTKA